MYSLTPPAARVPGRAAARAEKVAQELTQSARLVPHAPVRVVFVHSYYPDVHPCGQTAGTITTGHALNREVRTQYTPRQTGEAPHMIRQTHARALTRRHTRA